MTEKYGIKQIVLDEIEDLAKKYQIKKVILFGSRARGDYRQTSDIDLIYEVWESALFVPLLLWELLCPARKRKN